jgi:hypothetical protein
MKSRSKGAEANVPSGKLCIICHYDLESHRWMRPAFKGGHDFVPLKGKPIPHPWWAPEGEGRLRWKEHQ